MNTLAYHRAGTTGYMYFIVMDGTDAYDLTSVDHVELHVIGKDGTRNSWSTDDGSPQLYIDADPTTGILEFRPEATDLVIEKAPYRAYILVYVTTVRSESFPGDSDVEIIVLEA